MKRIKRWCMYTVLLLLLCACEKKEEPVLKPGIYILLGYEEREVPGDFTITIYEDGTFQGYETLISSYIMGGHYSIENDVVTLKEDMAGCNGDVNYYQIEDGNLRFLSEGFHNYHFVPLEDGALFEWTSEIE